MNYKKIKLAYPLRHWITSLVLAPIIFFGWKLIRHGQFEVEYAFLFKVVGSSAAMGMVFSYPILILYIALFNLCFRYVRHPWLIKIALNIFAIASAVLVIRFLLGPRYDDLLPYFAISIVASSLFFKVKPDLGEENVVNNAS